MISNKNNVMQFRDAKQKNMNTSLSVLDNVKTIPKAMKAL